MTADARRRAEEALAEYDRLWGAAHATNAYGSAVVGLASALRAILAAGPEAGAGGLDALAIEINEWAAVTFPFRTAASVAEHLRREAHELAEAPLDPEEMADVFILLANLWKFTGVDLPCAVAAKLAKNRARKWGKPDAQGVVEHVREGPQALAAGAATPPPPSDAVREAAEALRHKMREVYADSRYLNVWATAQERLGPYSGPDWIAESAALDAALEKLNTEARS